MPRNSSGNYVLPPGNPVVADTLIESAWANLTLDDVAGALTDSLDRNGRGGMLAPFRLADGTINEPGLSFANEPSAGLFRFGTNDIRMTVLGVPRMRWLASGGTQNWDGAAWRGFGTAAYAALTTSATDITAGRVTRVADFGLGAGRLVFPGVSNTPTALADIPGGALFTHSGGGIPGDAPVTSLSQGGGFKAGGADNAFTINWSALSSGRTWQRSVDSNGITAGWREYLFAQDNLARLTNVATARTNLGLGTAAVLNTGVSGATIPRYDGASNLFTGSLSVQNATGILSRRASTQDQMQLLGGVGGTSSRTCVLTTATLAATRIHTFPDRTGTVAHIDQIGSIGLLNSPLPIANGGTASTTVAAARTALGLGTAATVNTGSSGAAIPRFDNTQNLFTGWIRVENTSGVLTRRTATGDEISILGRDGGVDSRRCTLTTAALGGNRTHTFPDKGGTVAHTSDIGTIGALNSPLPIANGGTASTTVAAARTALGLGTAATVNTGTSGAVVGLLNTNLEHTGFIRVTEGNGIMHRRAATQDEMRLLGRAGGTGSFRNALTTATLTANRTSTFPDRTGTVAHIDQIGSIGLLNSPLPIANGGTASTTVTAARTALGLGTAATVNTGVSGATVPLLNGALTFSGGITFTGVIAQQNTNGAFFRRAANQDQIQIVGRAGGTTALNAALTTAALTANATHTLPNKSGTVQHVASRGSNANGEWVRFDDGLQICTRTVTHDFGITNSQDWLFAQAFITQPVGSFGVNGNTLGPINNWGSRNGSAWASGATLWRTRTPNSALAGQSAEVQLTAIGRWF